MYFLYKIWFYHLFNTSDMFKLIILYYIIQIIFVIHFEWYDIYFLYKIYIF